MFNLQYRIVFINAAKFLGLKTPIAYKWRKVGAKKLHYGMNFAYGGTGVFATLVPEPNMTTQIGFLQNLLHSSVYNISDLHSSVALVTLSGNDYSAYLAKGGSLQVRFSLFLLPPLPSLQQF